MEAKIISKDILFGVSIGDVFGCVLSHDWD